MLLCKQAKDWCFKRLAEPNRPVVVDRIFDKSELLVEKCVGRLPRIEPKDRADL